MTTTNPPRPGDDSVGGIIKELERLAIPKIPESVEASNMRGWATSLVPIMRRLHVADLMCQTLVRRRGAEDFGELLGEYEARLDKSLAHASPPWKKDARTLVERAKASIDPKVFKRELEGRFDDPQDLPREKANDEHFGERAIDYLERALGKGLQVGEWLDEEELADLVENHKVVDGANLWALHLMAKALLALQKAKERSLLEKKALEGNDIAPIPFAQSNVDMKKPVGWTDDQCATLPVYRDPETRECISVWSPGEEARSNIAKGQPIYLRVFMGGAQPPVCLSTRNPFGA